MTSLCVDAEGVLWLGFGRPPWLSGVSEPNAGLARYDGRSVIVFTTSDGLAHNDVAAVHSEPDGQLWVGTAGGGISRFDPKTFLTLNRKDGLGDDFVQSVYRDKDDTIWMATCSVQAGGISRFDGHDPVDFSAQIGLPSDCFTGIQRDTRGALWFSGGGGLYRYDETGLTNIFRGLWFHDVHCDPDGTVWSSAQIRLVRYDGASFVEIGLKDPSPGTHSPEWIHRSSGGPLWVGIKNAQTFAVSVARYDGKDLVPFTTRGWPTNENVLAFTSSASGILWLGTGNGIYRYDGKDCEHITTANGLVHHQVTKLFVARDGTLWCGTMAGVSRDAI